MWAGVSAPVARSSAGMSSSVAAAVPAPKSIHRATADTAPPTMAPSPAPGPPVRPDQAAAAPTSATAAAPADAQAAWRRPQAASRPSPAEIAARISRVPTIVAGLSRVPSVEIAHSRTPVGLRSTTRSAIASSGELIGPISAASSSAVPSPTAPARTPAVAGLATGTSRRASAEWPSDRGWGRWWGCDRTSTSRFTLTPRTGAASPRGCGRSQQCAKPALCCCCPSPS